MASSSEDPVDLKALAAKVRAPPSPQLNIRITQNFHCFWGRSRTVFTQEARRDGMFAGLTAGLTGGTYNIPVYLARDKECQSEPFGNHPQYNLPYRTCTPPNPPGDPPPPRFPTRQLNRQN